MKMGTISTATVTTWSLMREYKDCSAGSRRRCMLICVLFVTRHFYVHFVPMKLGCCWFICALMLPIQSTRKMAKLAWWLRMGMSLCISWRQSNMQQQQRHLPDENITCSVEIGIQFKKYRGYYLHNRLYICRSVESSRASRYVFASWWILSFGISWIDFVVLFLCNAAQRSQARILKCTRTT